MPYATITLAAISLAAALFTPTRMAAATAAGPVCRLPSVVAVMTRELRARSFLTRIDRALILEAPTPDPRLIRCDVPVEVVWYDTLRFGDAPVARWGTHAFSVEMLPNGFVVRFLQ